MGNYKIAWKIDDSQARTSILRGIKGLQDLEKQSLKTIKALELAHKSTASQVVNGYASMATASTSFNTAQFNGINRVTQATTAAARVRKAVAKDEADQIDIGLHKVQVTGIKFQDGLTKAAAKGASAREKIAEKEAADIRKIVNKAVTDDEKSQGKKAAQRQKLTDKAVADAHNAEITKLKGIEAIQDKAFMREHAQRGSQLRKQAAQEATAQRASSRFALGPNGGLLKGTRVMLGKDQLDHIAMNRGIDALNNRLIKARLAAQGLSSSFEEAIMSATGFSKVSTLMGGTAAAIGGALAGLNMLESGYRKIREDAEAAALATFALQKRLRVEGVLKGQPTGNEQVLKEALNLRAKTGLGADEASDLTRQFLGATPIGVQKGHIDQATIDKVLVEQGVLHNRQGGDAGTRGELAGMIPQFRKVKGVNDLLGEQEAIRFALTEGRGDDAPLTRQLLNVAGPHVREGGMVGTLPEMAALVGATSLTAGPEAAGTRTDQIIRSLEAGRTKHRKGQGAVESQADYLTKTLGIDEKEGLESQLDKVMADLGKAKKEGRNINTYLAERGFRNSEERQAIVELESNYKAVKGRFKVARESQDGAKVKAQNDAFLASPEGRISVGEVGADIAVATKGVSGKRLEAARAAAAGSNEARKGDQNAFTSTFGDFGRGIMMGHIPGISDDVTGAGRKDRIENIALVNMQNKARKMGVSEEALTGARQGSFGAPNWAAEFTNRVEALIESKGGTNAIDNRPELNALTVEMKRVADLFGGKKAPAMVNLGAPAAGPIGP